MAKDAASFDYDYDSESVPLSAIFVAADEPVLIYPSVAAAEQDLEAIDVETGVYPIAFTQYGEPYSIDVRKKCVVIEATGEPNRPEELRQLLLRYAEATGKAVDANTSLDVLVLSVWTDEASFWIEHDPYGERFGKRIPTWGCLGFLSVIAITLYLAFR